MLCIEYMIWEHLKEHVVCTSKINWWNKNTTDSYAKVLIIIRTSMNGNDNNNN